jgi:small subunit ribosomal protein S21
MVEVVVNDGDDLERVLRRFKRRVQKAGIFTDLKRKKYYEKPSETRKRKRNAAIRRSRRNRRR